MKKVYTVEGKVQIKNAKGTGEKDCKCGSWKDHWEKYSKKKATECSVDKCTDTDIVGAHVTRPNAKKEEYKTHPYIVPMCKEHNGKHGEEFTSKENVTFVWANVKETCGS